MSEMERPVAVHPEIERIHMVDMLSDGCIIVVGDVDVTTPLPLTHTAHPPLFADILHSRHGSPADPPAH